MTKWVDALKKWNAEKGGAWCVPRKGTPEYEKVMAIMKPPAAPPAPAPAAAGAGKEDDMDSYAKPKDSKKASYTELAKSLAPLARRAVQNWAEKYRGYDSSGRIRKEAGATESEIRDKTMRIYNDLVKYIHETLTKTFLEDKDGKKTSEFAYWIMKDKKYLPLKMFKKHYTSRDLPEPALAKLLYYITMRHVKVRNGERYLLEDAIPQIKKEYAALLKAR